MRLADLNGKKVCILGFGKEGRSVWNAIEKYAPDAKMTVADKNSKALEELSKPERVTSLTSGYTLQSGEGTWLREIESFDVIIKSPGIPPSELPESVRSKITTPTNIFLDEVAAIGATMIGVTGSKGKSTTSSLIHHLLKAGDLDSILCGNIGVPALDTLEKLTKDSIVVMEMSSYQLMDAVQSPHIAVLTSFFPEHLDYHGSVEAYWNAKANIVRFQTEKDFTFFNAENEDAILMAALSKGNKVPFSYEECPIELSQTKLIGDHNRSNISAAYEVARYFDVSDEVSLEALRSFEPLPHRLQSLGVHHGITWIDDAISTTPDSTIAALQALGPNVATIILGGTDRGLEFDVLADELVHHTQVSTVILFPGTGPKIRREIEKSMNTKVDRKITLSEADSMELAVKISKENTPTGKICLLSTASPSYNMFKNFEEKGERFAKEISR